MSEEIRVGDRVHGSNNQMLGTVVSDTQSVRVHWDGDKAGTSYIIPVGTLTRIEPDVPQPKFRVGQRVRVVSDPTGPLRRVTRIEIDHHGARYFMDYSSVGFPESELEAVPEACPTCGQEMRDGN